MLPFEFRLFRTQSGESVLGFCESVLYRH
jgi:hypothetical protein